MTLSRLAILIECFIDYFADVTRVAAATITRRNKPTGPELRWLK